MKIQTKLITVLVLVALIPVVTISVLEFLSAKTLLEDGIKEHLSTTAEVKADWIESYFVEKKGDLHVLSETPIVVESLGLQSREVHFLEEYQEVYGYYDIFLISSEGYIFYSVEHESDYGTNLADGPYSDTGLADVYKAAESLDYDEVAISNFEYYEPSDGFAAFFAIPVYEDAHSDRGNLLGVLATQINLDDMHDILLQRTGLGETGETLLAQRGDDGEAIFFTERRFEDDAEALPTISKDRLEVPIIQALLQNEDIFSGSIDYRGEKVLAATRYIAEVDWGLVAKIDESEAFAPVMQLMNWAWILNLIVVVFLFVIGVLIAKSFTKPITNLTRAASDISKGDYDVKIENINSKDEIGKLARVFKEMSEILAAQEREKYEFITSASHQIRTPASGVRNALQLLKDRYSKKGSDPETKELIDDLVANNARVIKITNNLFKLLELGGSYKASNTDEVKLKELINQIFESYEEEVLENMFKVDVDIPSDVVIDGEENRIKDLFINLIENAINFSSQGGKITVRAKSKAGMAYIEVIDTGIGVPKKEQIHMFEEFFRAKNAYLKSSVGSGLGLAIVKRIIEGHGGEIRFKSEEGKGTTFILTLPVVGNDSV